jgi:TRAP-type mannitol/chloroaromatic compound transport system permease large subunit
VLIFLVLGTLLLGLATPTESGAMGSVGAIVIATLRHRELGASGRRALPALVAGGGGAAILGILAFKSTAFQLAIAVLYAAIAYLCVRAAMIATLRELIRKAFEATMRITSMVVFILIGSTCFSVVFQGVNGGPWLEHWLGNLPGGVWGFLLFVNLFVFFLAFFLDFFEIVFIIVPLLAPVAKTILAPVVGEDAALIWFGVMLCVNLQTSFMHPPFGFALFYLRGVAPKEVKSADIYWGALPWVGLQLVLVALVIAFPKQVTMFLDQPGSIDLDKVRIEIPAEAERRESPAADEELQRLLERK